MIDTVWTRGQVTLADTRHDDTIAAMAERILRENVGDIAVLGQAWEGTSPSKSSAKRRSRHRSRTRKHVRREPTPRSSSKRGRASPCSLKAGISTLLSTPPSLGVVAADNESDDALLATWRSMTSPVGAQAFLRQQQAVVQRADLRSILPSIACPTAIIHGAQDRLIPLNAAEEMAEALPTARFTVVEGAGHFLFHEQPAAARDAVSSWLESAT